MGTYKTTKLLKTVLVESHIKVGLKPLLENRAQKQSMGISTKTGRKTGCGLTRNLKLEFLYDATKHKFFLSTL
jgi:hypothetical protein